MNLKDKLTKIADRVAKIERKYKLITYGSLAFLTFTTNSLRIKVKESDVALATLKQKNLGLKENMIIYNRTFEEVPLAIWSKVKRGDYFLLQYLNPQYTKLFGHLYNNNRLNVIGKNNYEVLPDNYEIADEYNRNDMYVSITGNPINTTEYSVDSLGNKLDLKVWKWRDIIGKKDTIVFGMVTKVIKR